MIIQGLDLEGQNSYFSSASGFLKWNLKLSPKNHSYARETCHFWEWRSPGASLLMPGLVHHPLPAHAQTFSVPISEQIAQSKWFAQKCSWKNSCTVQDLAMARPLLPMLLYLLMELGICCFCALNSGFAYVKPHVFPEALVQCDAQAHNLVNTQAKFGPICMSG